MYLMIISYKARICLEFWQTKSGMNSLFLVRIKFTVEA